LTPSLGIPCTSPGNCLRGLRHSRHAHRAWSQRFHRLVRRGAPKTYTKFTNSNIAERGYLISAQHSTRNAGRGDAPASYQQEAHRTAPLRMDRRAGCALHPEDPVGVQMASGDTREHGQEHDMGVVSRGHRESVNQILVEEARPRNTAHSIFSPLISKT
jgi:hypothetical protein